MRCFVSPEQNYQQFSAHLAAMVFNEVNMMILLETHSIFIIRLLNWKKLWNSPNLRKANTCKLPGQLQGGRLAPRAL